ncbi:hypothetical protein [Tritonibacter mobilis]|uniref:hypothetical protein n=1 Tax=Tritonibacter mobilis TaxID=379347 RepID=UPI0001B8AEEF|nr:hypothetical protein [Tritonibacter mobilis]EEW57125.1 conserved hypothetical protein [Ruegeria sp. TrichCH4B]NKX75673.1 hypothetical protein [Rhodobacteraceae bacterium R_SAG3]
MTAQTPEELIEISSDLLRSLHDSLRRARRISEDYLAQFEAEQDINPDTALLKPQIAKLDGLIRDIQKVEKTLVDRKDAPGAARMVAFDLCAARDEIERRLAGLCAALHDADLAGGDG